MAKAGFWSRVGGWIRSDTRHFTDTDDSFEQETLASGDSDDVVAASRISTALSRRGRRDVSLRKLQEGYDRVLDLMDQMQQHMLTQESRTEAIAASLVRLNETLADVAESDHRRTEILSSISAELETTKIRTQQLADAMAEMPRAVRDQTDALTGMQKQLELGAEADANLDATLQSFGRGVDRLSESTETQAQVLKDLQAADEMRSAQITEILQRQTRLFMILVILAALLTAVGIGGGVAYLLMVMG